MSMQAGGAIGFSALFLAPVLGVLWAEHAGKRKQSPKRQALELIRQLPTTPHGQTSSINSSTAPTLSKALPTLQRGN